MVTEATKKPEPETPFPDDFEDDDEDMDDSPEQIAGHHTLGTRGVVRGGGCRPRSGLSPAPMQRTSSSKSVNTISRKPGHLQTSLANTSTAYDHNPPTAMEKTPDYDHQPAHNASSPADTTQSINLSPNTIESHPAPSLVFDDEDYQNTHSESETPTSGAVSDDEGSLDVQVKEHDHHAMDLDTPGESSTADFAMEKAAPSHTHPPRPRNKGVRSSKERKNKGRGRRGGK